VNVMRKFEENLEVLGFELAPVAWDLAKFPFPNDDERRAVLEEMMGGGDVG
jgi:hypothetical protein